MSSFFVQNSPIEEKVPEKPRIIVSRSHTGLVKEIINQKLNNAEIITAAGSGSI